jgi:transcriptional regulator of heat shock response
MKEREKLRKTGSNMERKKQWKKKRKNYIKEKEIRKKDGNEEGKEKMH